MKLEEIITKCSKELNEDNYSSILTEVVNMLQNNEHLFVPTTICDMCNVEFKTIQALDNSKYIIALTPGHKGFKADHLSNISLKNIFDIVLQFKDYSGICFNPEDTKELVVISRRYIELICGN